jgi:hypothetical protein
VLVVGFVPVILMGWLGFIFLQYPKTFGQFVYFSYLILPFLAQVVAVVFRASRVFWYLKYGTHGIAKLSKSLFLFPAFFFVHIGDCPKTV